MTYRWIRNQVSINGGIGWPGNPYPSLRKGYHQNGHHNDRPTATFRCLPMTSPRIRDREA
jgi:hypothetical protein